MHCLSMDERRDCENVGKRIGFKALKNRLNQMWAMNEIMNIVDLVQEYYMVSFTSEEG